MKKITDFIVDKRILVFILMLTITITSLIFSNKVEINRDITQYLPKDSETKIGLDIMDKEFNTTPTSTINIMFDNLSNEEKQKIKTELSSMPEVKEVLYDETEKYNKDNHTLYVITINDSKKSQTASNFYDKITSNYKNYTFTTSGEISDEYKTILPIYITILAILCALIILIIMCDSYIEPFLFLIAIGMGVGINQGTNLIFGSISSITSSISAILQLALSMDYSIMLINRYRQEKEKETNNILAMKQALHKSFSSISSSSVTTIVGLLALIFMSFTIGKDLGLVLAKGVLLSLLTIFTCLPFLILTFDKLITKTKKKTLNIKLNKLSKITCKMRNLGTITFVLVFILSILLKGNLGILYTDSDNDEIKKIFDTNNQIAIVYKNEYEDTISKYIKTLEPNNKIDEILCYGNTINEPLTYEKLNPKLKQLKQTTTIDPYLLKIIYYNYYNKEEPTMTIDEFITFIKNDIYKNEEMNTKINDQTKQNIDKLSNFTNTDKINQKRSPKEISDIFNIDLNTINDLLIYYNSINEEKTLTIKEFVKFMNNYVVNSKYSSNIDLNKLKTITQFTNQDDLSKKLKAKEMANLLGMDENMIQNIYLYYQSTSDIDYQISINTLASFITNNILKDEQYSNLFDDTTKEKIMLLNTFSNENIINNKLSIKEMSSLLSIEEEITSNIYFLNFKKEETDLTLTIKEFIENLQQIKANTHYLDNVDISKFNNIPTELLLTTTTYDAHTLAQLLNIDEQTIKTIYTLIEYQKNIDTYKLTPYEFVTLIISKEEISKNIPQDKITKLNTLYYIMSNSKKTYSYEEFANTFNLEPSDVKNIYALYGENNIELTPTEFIQFLLEHQQDAILSNKLTPSTIANLKNLNKIIDTILKNEHYKYDELARLLGIKTEDVRLLYSLYEINYDKKNITISYKQFIDFLVNNVITNEKYKNNFTQDKITTITTIKKIMNNSINNTKYTKEELFGIIKILSDDIDYNLVDLLYIYYGSNNNYDDTWTLTLETFINYLNDTILPDERFDEFIDEQTKNDIKKAKTDIQTSKEMLVGTNYSRIILNTKYQLETEDAFAFMEKLTNDLKQDTGIYLTGNTPMAYEMDKTFENELNFITILTIIFIFIIVALTFKSLIIPIILVIIIQTAVYITMGILSFESGTVYFIALLIVQSILMGATIDYAILYTSYYIESRKKQNIKESIKKAYNNSIHTILTSASILSIVTLIIGRFSSATASKICLTISQGTICSTILILLFLPALLGTFDKYVIKRNV